MKKRRLNLPKLSLNKEVIGNLSQEQIRGGASAPIVTCLQTCLASCGCTHINCISSDPNDTCFVGCITTMICP